MPYLSEEETELVRSFILLPYAKKNLEKDLTTISGSKAFKITSPYESIINDAIKKISVQLQQVKREMHKNGIKVVEKEREEMFVTYSWFCRGYQGEMKYITHNIRNQVEQIMSEYL
ncbi:hypothetical protein [Bacillus sp. FJAT-45350]|uniref:hypothetical protein n=1 Tax=Bacillus sp. FJAT-45350 TaxID=2011014 RepID=UPI000BB76AD7|nr:hypothetical protein [Bacillus sp. FJAT-45350]